MATTTNYGWTTPDDTALVKDGAAAIRTLGSSVDTTTKNLNPETTLGDISYRSSTANVNTRLPLGTAGQVLKVNSGATAPEWSSDNAGMTNPMTTTGDTIYSSSGSTPARLAIGSTGNVLTVAGGVPTWAAPAAGGGITLLSTTTLSGTSVTVSGISQSYTNLYGELTGSFSGASARFKVLPNNTNASTTGVSNAGATNSEIVSSENNSSGTNYCYFSINNYTASAGKAVVCIGAGSGGVIGFFGGYDQSAAPVTSIVVITPGGTATLTGTLKLYGVK